MAQLESDYSAAQEDLNDTVNQHMMELSSNALSDLRDTLQEAFDDYWNNIALNFNDIKKLMAEGNNLSAESYSALGKLLDFYNISYGGSQIPVSAGYASGTKSVPFDMLAWTQEHGDEIIVRKSDGAMLTPLKAGDGVVPSYLTKRIYDIAQGNIPAAQIKAPKLDYSDLANANKIIVENHDDHSITIQGSVDTTTLEEMKKMTKNIVQESYEYTQNRMAKDMLRAGFSRRL